MLRAVGRGHGVQDVLGDLAQVTGVLVDEGEPHSIPTVDRSDVAKGRCMVTPSLTGER